MSRDRKRKRLPAKKRPDRADALDIAWRAGAYIEEVIRFDTPPENYDPRQESEKRTHPSIAYSTTEDRRAVALWFADTREPKIGPETGRTSSRALAVIGSAQPWWRSEFTCTQGRVRPMQPFTMGA
jgi:hypothetical protein